MAVVAQYTAKPVVQMNIVDIVTLCPQNGIINYVRDEISARKSQFDYTRR